MSTQARIETLEEQVAALAERVRVLETRPADHRRAAAHAARPAPAAPAPAAAPRRAAPLPVAPPPVTARRPAPFERPLAGDALEDLLGGRVLAWAGGLAVLLGVVFLFTIAVSRGWIGEAERVLIAGAGSLALLGTGVWLHERRGRTDAARAAVGSAIAALFATVTVAARVYDLIPAAAGFPLAIAIGAVATALAIRWAARPIAALGIVGALLGPPLVGAPEDLGTLALLATATAAACAVAVWRRWEWVGPAAIVVTIPQWAVWALFAEDAPTASLLIGVMTLFGLLGGLSAIGYELRVPVTRLRVSAAFALMLNALALAGLGWVALGEVQSTGLANAWLAAVAVAHLAAGAACWRSRRVAREVDLLLLGVGFVLADITLGIVLDGPVLAVMWAAGGAAFALALRRSPTTGLEGPLAGAGVGGHLALALGHALASDAPAGLLARGEPVSAAGFAALAALASACFVSARLADRGHARWRTVLDAAGLATVAYLAAVTLDGAPLAAVWALEAAALAALARRTGDRLAAQAALAHLGLAIAHALVFEAPAEALTGGLPSVPAAALALGAAALAALWLAHLRTGEPEARPWLVAVGALALLHLASTAIVTPFADGAAALDGGALDGRQQSQVALSGLWAVTGVAALLLGLARDLRAVRLAALALLLTTAAKVFLYDLRALDSGYRVASFIALGLLLLGGAYAWQRARPRALPDLRDTPEATA